MNISVYSVYNMNMRTLKEIFNDKGFNYYPTDKETTHCYLDTYDKLFKPYQGDNINILEVGVHEGGSLRLWNDYFINGIIYGYDIVNIVRPGILNERVQFKLQNINNINIYEFKDTPLTIAIDDGSHILSDQLTFVKVIYPQLVEGGLLIIEDIQNIDKQKEEFDKLNIPFEIIDLRHVHNRYDDVLLVFRK